MITTDQFTISVINDGAPGGTGPTGPAGATLSSQQTWYYYSTSPTSLENGSWSTTQTTPIPTGRYLWTKQIMTMSDGTSRESTAVHESTIQNIVSNVDNLNGQIVNKVEQSDIISELTAYDGGTSSVTNTVRNRVSQTEQDITGITSRVGAVESTTTGLSTRMTTAESNITQNANKIAAAVTVTEDGQTHETSITLTPEMLEAVTDQFVVKSPDGNRTVISGGQMATNAVQSNNYVAPTTGNNGTTPFSVSGSKFDLSNGDIITPAFSVDHDGNAKVGNSTNYVQFNGQTGQLSAAVSSLSIGGNTAATQSYVTTAVGNMKIPYLILSHAAISKNTSGTYNPVSLVMSAKQQAGDGAVSDYTGRFKIETTTDNSSWTVQHTTGDVTTYTYTIPASIVAVRCSLYKQGGTTTLLDQQTLPIVSDGAKGDPGQTGTSVTITSKSVEYKEGTSGTEAPTGNWSSTIPSVTPGNYLWTKTVVNYSDGNSTTAYSVAREGANGTNGTNGTSPTVSSTDRKYAQTTNGTTPPASSSSDWKTSPPTAVAGQYMWTKTTVTYSDGATSESYTVSKNGTNGGNGINTATVYLYQRATSQPSKPSNALTYTFSTCTLFGTLGSWQQSIPTGTNPCWITFATASGTGTTDEIASTEWTTPIKLEGVDGQNGQPGTNGTNGYNQATIFLYQRSTSTPSKPTGSITYTFSTGALSQVPTNWSRTVPQNDGNPCYVTTATAFSNTTTDTIASTDWSDVVKLVEDGNDGADAYTVILTNENHTFVGDTTSAIATSVDCNVIAYKGATQVAATIGTITGQPTGMTTAVQNNSSTTAKFTVTVSTSMVSPHGVLAVPVTVDGKTFDMTFTYSLVLMGEKGDTGVGISSVTELYYGSDSSTAPAKPTAHVTTSNFATHNEWNLQCPTWTSTYQYYYTCQEILYDDGTYSWSDVAMNNGYSGANSNANAALITADSANTTASNGLKRLKIYDGTTDTAANTSTKVVTCSDTDFSQVNGATITVTFTMGHTASSLYLIINNKASKQAYFNDNVINSSNPFKFGPEQKVTFRYNGTYWVVTNFESESYFVCPTGASTASKSIGKSSDVSFVLYKGAKINVYFQYANTYNGTLSLNVYGTSAYNIRYKNAAVSSSNKFQWSAGTTIPFTFDGTYWHVSDGGAVDAKTTAVEAAKTATNYLYYDSTNGLVVHQSASEISGVSDLTGNVGNIRLTGSGMDVYRGQDCVASYGSMVTIGKSDGKRVEILNSELRIVDENNNDYATFGSSTRIGNIFMYPTGTIDIYDNNNNVVSSFGDTVRIGKNDDSNMLLTSNGLFMYNSDTRMAKFGSDGDVLIGTDVIDREKTQCLTYIDSEQRYDDNGENYGQYYKFEIIEDVWKIIQVCDLAETNNLLWFVEDDALWVKDGQQVTYYYYGDIPGSTVKINANGLQYNNAGDEAFYVGVEQRVTDVSEEEIISTEEDESQVIPITDFDTYYKIFNLLDDDVNLDHVQELINDGYVKSSTSLIQRVTTSQSIVLDWYYDAEYNIWAKLVQDKAVYVNYGDFFSGRIRKNNQDYFTIFKKSSLENSLHVTNYSCEYGSMYISGDEIYSTRYRDRIVDNDTGTKYTWNESSVYENMINPEDFIGRGEVYDFSKYYDSGRISELYITYDVDPNTGEQIATIDEDFTYVVQKISTGHYKKLDYYIDNNTFHVFVKRVNTNPIIYYRNDAITVDNIDYFSTGFRVSELTQRGWTNISCITGEMYISNNGYIFSTDIYTGVIDLDRSNPSDYSDIMLWAASDSVVQSLGYLDVERVDNKFYYKICFIPNDIVVKSVVRTSDKTPVDWYVENDSELWAEDYLVTYTLAYVADTTSPYFVFGPNNYSSDFPAGQHSFAAGEYCSALGNDQAVFGKYNIRKSDLAFIIGNGKSDSRRSNAFEVDWYGNVMSYGSLYSENDDITLADINRFVFG